MAPSAGAGLRLRPAVWPSAGDSDSDDAPEAMDEQEQESLISRLAAENASRNRFFCHLLLALTLLAALAQLPLLLRPRSALGALFGLSSLLSTAYLLHRLPPTVSGFAPLDAWSRRRHSPPPRPAGPRLSLQSPDSPLSPLLSHLPYLNLGLALTLLLADFVAGRRHSGPFAWLGIGSLPALVYAFVLMAKLLMGGVDPEEQLSRLKYRYKGA